MDLAEFLAARLDEDEAAAHRADTGERWEANQHYDALYSVDLRPGSSDESLGIPGCQPFEDPAHFLVCHDQASHIERHDPARVLREVEAKRAILRECKAAEKLNDLTGRERDLFRSWLLRTLAAVYSDHPDYREEWKP